MTVEKGSHNSLNQQSSDALKHIESTQWVPSNMEPLIKVLPEQSFLQTGIPMLDRTMFALSNTDLKSAIMLYGLTTEPEHMNTIAGRVFIVLSDLWSKRPQPYNAARFIEDFMCPPGFAYISEPEYYAATPDGEFIGKNSAAFILKKSVDLGIPLGPILQLRTKDKPHATHSYIMRLASLIALRDESLSHAQLLERMGGNLPGLADNLRVLSDKKLIVYEGINPEVKGQYLYERADISAIPSNASSLVRNIAKYFEHNEIGNIYSIAQALKLKWVEYVNKGLRQLTEAGVIKPVKWKFIERQSLAQITPLGKRSVDEVIIPLLATYAGDEHYAQMLADARIELTRNPVIATQALDQYRSQRVETPELETQWKIIQLIKNYGALRRRQILEAIGKKAHPQLIQLIEQGQLRTIREGNASFYVLPDSHEEPKIVREVVVVDFRPPQELLDLAQPRKRDEYRKELDTVKFWKRLNEEIQKIRPERYSIRDFLLKYDPRYPDWSQRWDSGIFSGHIRALRSLGIKNPEQFIRTYRSSVALPELEEVIVATQVLINNIFPKESKRRNFNRTYMDRLETAEFWLELESDAQSIPPGTSLQAFLLLFDPNIEGKILPRGGHGKYYSFRLMVRKYTDTTLASLLIAYRSSENTSLTTQLAVRKSQAAIRKHLKIKKAPEDDFSDIPKLERLLAEQEEERRRKQERFAELKNLFDRFQRFDEYDVALLLQCDVSRVQELEGKIKGMDYDEVSFARMGLSTVRTESNQNIPAYFPAEPRAAFLTYLFELWRRGEALPKIPKYDEDVVLQNGLIRSSLRTIEYYLSYYETELKKRDPETQLNAKMLLDLISRYMETFVEKSRN